MRKGQRERQVICVHRLNTVTIQTHGHDTRFHRRRAFHLSPYLLKASQVTQRWYLFLPVSHFLSLLLSCPSLFSTQHISYTYKRPNEWVG